jgi:hypothetical protein
MGILVGTVEWTWQEENRLAWKIHEVFPAGHCAPEWSGSKECNRKLCPVCQSRSLLIAVFLEVCHELTSCLSKKVKNK